MLPQFVEAAVPGTYKKSFVGKWSVGSAVHEMWPLRRGFDTSFGLVTSVLLDWYAHTADMEKAGLPPIFDWHRDDAPTTDYAGVYSTFALRDEAISHIDSLRDGERLFLYQAWNAVHRPVAVPEEHAEELGIAELMNAALDAGELQVRATYLGALKLVDDANAAIFDALGDEAVSTVWVQMSDNGGAVPYGGNNYPLRGRKGQLWQGAFVVPCFLWLGADLRAPGFEPGAIYDGLFHVSDWLPTLLGGVLGADLSNAGLYGMDLWGSLLGDDGAPSRDDVLLFADYDPEDPNDTQYAYRTTTHKVITGTSLCEVADARLASTGAYCVCDALSSSNKTFVLDLVADPSESVNLLDDPTVDATLLDGLRRGVQRAWDANVAAAQCSVSMPSAAIAAAREREPPRRRHASVRPTSSRRSKFLDAMPDPGPAWPFGELPCWHRRIGQPQRPPEFSCR